eukprot:s1_g404.t1
MLVWIGLRNDVVWGSFVGEADREALQIAFEMRVNKTLPGSHPILFLNLDDSVWQGATADGPALAYAPRPVLADLIEAAYGTPGLPRPKVVIVDIDLFWRTPDEAAEQRIDALLKKWGRDPEAPLLILQREVTEGDGRPDSLAAARASDRDAIIESAPEDNIVWASAQLTGDEVMGARYFTHFLCIDTPAGIQASPTTAFYAAVGRKSETPREAIKTVQKSMDGPRSYCTGTWDDVEFDVNIPGRDAMNFKGQQSLINYNLHAGDADDPEPQLPAADMFVIPAGMVEPGMVAGLSANDGVVIIGSAAIAARDRHISAYGAMGGSLVIANVIRGVEAGGEVRRMAWYLEAILLTLFVMLIVLAFWYCRKARDYLRPMDDLHWAMRVARTPINLLTNPVIIKILIGIGVFWVGAGASDVVSLKTASDRVVLGIAGNSGPNEIRGPKSYTVGPASTGSQSLSELIEGRLLPLGDRLVGQGLARSGGEFGFGLLDLETESAQIKSGFRPLWVGWTGGQAPYELLVLDPTDRIFASQTLSDTSTTLPARTITPGRYTIVVKDAYGRTRQTFFDAVDDVPEASPPSVPAWMGEDTAVMLAAFCVAAEDPYVWSYEAAQQISGARDAGLDRDAALALIGGGDSDALCPR